MTYRIRGETVVRWTATVTEESGETNAEDATAKACEEAQDAIAGAETFVTLGVALELKHHYTAASGCQRIEPPAPGEGCGEDRLNLAGDGRPDHGTARTAVGRTLRSDPGATPGDDLTSTANDEPGGEAE